MTDDNEFVGTEYEFTFTIVPHWLLEKLKPIEITTYIALGQYADNKTKECWPSVSRLAKDINRSRYSTIKALKGLEENNVIEVKQRFKHKGEQTSNLYILKLTPPSRKLDTESKENKTPRDIENLTQTISNITKPKELYFDTYTKQIQEQYVDVIVEVFNLSNITKNKWGQIYNTAKQLYQAKVYPEQIPTLVKNCVITYGEKYTTVNSILNHTELLSGARTKSSKDVQEIIDTKSLESWANETD